MSLLLKIRFKSLFAGIKKSIGAKSAGMLALFGVLMGFSALIIMALLFGIWFVFGMYLESDYPWLYFAMAGIFAFALGIFGTVFTTQSQMYEAKDNELLLAMPLKPSQIIGSRVLMLYLLTFLFSAIIMLPAAAVYCILRGPSVTFVLIFLLVMGMISMVTQTVTCLLGWVLHFLLAKFKYKALLASLFMAVVMILYFVGIGNLENLTVVLTQNGGKIANAVQSFAWPFYAMGQACMGDILQFVLFTVFSFGVFGLVMWVLTKTFIKAMLVGGKAKSATKQKRDRKIRTPEASLCRKESKRFFSSTTYLVNTGLGLFMMLALIVAGVIFKDKIMNALQSQDMLEGLESFIPAVIVGIMGFITFMTPISAPSVSLEGNHLWILRSMPISGAKVLRGKLRFHCIATVPMAFVGTLALCLVYGCPILDTLLAAVCSALLNVLCGVLGLVFNMCFPRMDWPTEAAPCKQSGAVVCIMFAMMFVSFLVFGGGLVGTGMMGPDMSAVVLGIMAAALALITYLFYLLLVKWGGKKFETL
ncbi:MAG: hypothetical protein J6J38_10890 [Lachnospiraceae bacterium]|nr:hypothetical protein [Lachnospiraceae bacterium]